MLDMRNEIKQAILFFIVHLQMLSPKSMKLFLESRRQTFSPAILAWRYLKYEAYGSGIPVGVMDLCPKFIHRLVSDQDKTFLFRYISRKFDLIKYDLFLPMMRLDSNCPFRYKITNAYKVKDLKANNIAPDMLQLVSMKEPFRGPSALSSNLLSFVSWSLHGPSVVENRQDRFLGDIIVWQKHWPWWVLRWQTR